MIKPQPMVSVDDVGAASRWFCEVLGLSSGHGGPDYEMLMDGDTMIAQLHRWESHEHPHLGDPTNLSRGNGVLLWFSTDDFEGVVARATAAKTTVLDGPLTNPNSRLSEVWMRGPEGYTVVASSHAPMNTA